MSDERPATFDIAILGAGPGGYIAALEAARRGARTAIVERDQLGGTCLNRGCIPSKALLASAQILHQIRRADAWGVRVRGPVDLDWPAIQKHKERIIRRLRAGVASLLKARGVELFEGAATLAGPGRIRVRSGRDAGRLLDAREVLIATGSTPARIPGWPADPERIHSAEQAVHWERLPGDVLIVGGGAIGCEFACMLQAFGVRVTLIEQLPGLLPALDAELGAALAAIFEERGITCHTGASIAELRCAADHVEARLADGRELSAERVLVAAGRSPASSALGLEQAGIATDERGFIRVDDRLRTSAPGHHCIGDANGRHLLAHAASAQGLAAVADALGAGGEHNTPVPAVVYTFPEVAAVGLGEQHCRRAGLPIAVGHYPIAHLGKAMAARCPEGFVKMIRHRESGAILGAHMIGHGAGECIGAALALVHQGAPMRAAAEMAWAHPSMGEALKESAADALGAALHLPPREILRATCSP